MGLKWNALSPESVDELVASLVMKFVHGVASKSRISDSLDGCRSWHDPKAWSYIHRYCKDGEVFVVVDLPYRLGYVFESAADWTQVLGETTGFEFYMTDRETTYLVGHNDHDYLIVGGDIPVSEVHPSQDSLH